MLTLTGACGWIPNTTVNFIANIIGIIKVFVPLLIIIMGSIDFAKAVMSQKEDEIKKSQTNFIQKLVAGAAVFFVMIFISWVFRIIDNADSSLNTGNAISCVNSMLNGGYNAENIDTLNPTTTNQNNTTTNNASNSNKSYKACIDKCGYTNGITSIPSGFEKCTSKCGKKQYSQTENICIDAYYVDYDTYINSDALYECTNQDPSNAFLFPNNSKIICYETYVINKIETCINKSTSFSTIIESENNAKDACMTSNNCKNINDCIVCGNSVDKYNYCSSRAYEIWSTSVDSTDVEYINDEEKFLKDCYKGDVKGNTCYIWNNGNPNGINTCCKNDYNKMKKNRNDYIEKDCSKQLNDTVKHYCETEPSKCPFYFN